MSNTSKIISAATAARKRRLSVLACAPGPLMVQLWSDFSQHHGEPDHEVLRGPEVGTIMVRGRAGAIGAAFNLGEMTVTRMSVRLGSGHVGHGHVQGRDRDAARCVAFIDALCEAGQAEALEAAIIDPLAARRVGRSAERAAKAAATKVEFFTMVRGS
jgi:alpha-D-ribose 1-methylphosphonate 5-triphosphate synthase subunit PhnG